MAEFVFCVCLGIIIGLALGFPFGFLCSKKTYDQEIFDVGFASGYQYGKDSFYNPSAKG